MKRILFNGLLSALVAVGFSSCLGSTDGTVDNQNDFAYVTQNSDGYYNELYAVTGSRYYVTSDVIRKLAPNSCYYISYKLSTKSMATSNIFEAEYSAVVKELKKTDVLRHAVVEDPAQPDKYKEVLKSISIGTRAVTDFYGDNWVIGYNGELAKGENYEMYFYYDADNQVDEPKVAGEAGAVIEPTDARKIIDIRFVKVGTALAGETSKQVSDQFVANFAAVRTTFKQSGMVNGTEDQYGNKYVGIKFRYWKETGKDETKLVYVGTWGTKDNNSTLPTYSLAYTDKPA